MIAITIILFALAWVFFNVFGSTPWEPTNWANKLATVFSLIGIGLFMYTIVSFAWKYLP